MSQYSHYLIIIKVPKDKVQFMHDLLEGEEYSVKPCKPKVEPLPSHPLDGTETTGGPMPETFGGEPLPFSDKNAEKFHNAMWGRPTPSNGPLPTGAAPFITAPVNPVGRGQAAVIMQFARENPKPFTAADRKLEALLKSHKYQPGGYSSCFSRLIADRWLTRINPGQRPAFYVVTPLTPEQIAQAEKPRHVRFVSTKHKKNIWKERTRESDNQYGKAVMAWLASVGPQNLNDIALHFIDQANGGWPFSRTERVAYALVREGVATRDGKLFVLVPQPAK